MQRRHLFALCALPVFAACASRMPSYTVTAAQLQAALAARFPRRQPVAGLAELELQAPRLRLLPEENRVGAELALQAFGGLLQRSYPGVLDVDFGLRYEAADRSLRATAVRLNALRIDGLPPRAAAVLQGLGAALAGQALGEVVLHHLRDKDLALADGLGMQPGPITVTPQGLRIDFVPRAAP